MARAIVAGTAYRSRWRTGALEVEGPDEDPVTIAAELLEALVDRPGGAAGPVVALDLVGRYNAEAEAALPELLGVPHVAVRHHGEGPGALAAALALASRAPSDGRALVAVVDPSTPATAHPESGAGGVAFEIAEGVGLSVLEHGGRRHAAHHPPDAEAWCRAATASTGLASPSSALALQLVAREAPPVLLSAWRRQQPEASAETSPAAPVGLGAAPTVPTALGLRRLVERLGPGGEGILATVGVEATHFLGVRLGGPVAWNGAWEPVAPPTLLRDARSEPDLATAVSEGAYVPRPRYLENLPARWRFEGERCSRCASVTFPPRGLCRRCRAVDGLTRVALPRDGTVVAATVVAPGAQPTEFDPLVSESGGYGVVLLELSEGVRVTLPVADAPGEAPPIGATVTTRLRRLYPMDGEWRYGRKVLARRP